MEAGSFLVSKPANSNAELGRQIVAMTPGDTLDGYEAGETDFNPDVPGLYVFRRVINVDPTTHVEEFAYEAYYYTKGMDETTKDQQVSNANGKVWIKHDVANNTDEEVTLDTDPTDDAAYTYTAKMETVTDKEGIGEQFYKVTDLQITSDNLYYAGDNNYDDGIIDSATFKFVKEVTETIKPVDMTYEADNGDHGKRLVVTYNTIKTVQSDLNDLATAYDNALIAYQDALNEYKAAARDLNDGTNPALAAAANTLQQKIDALQKAENELAAQDKLVKELKAKMDAAEAAKNEATTALQEATTAYNNAVNTYNSADAAYQSAHTAAENKASSIATNEQTNYTNAKSAREAAEGTSDEAAFLALFDDYVNAHKNDANEATEMNVTTDGTTPVNLTNVTYDQLYAMHLENNFDTSSDPGYQYWRLVMAEKAAKDALDAANEQLAALRATEANALLQKKDAEDAKDKAEEAKNAANTALNGANGAQAAFDAAESAYNTANTDLGTSADANDGTSNTYWGKRNKAFKDVNDARTEYEAALAAANQDKTDLETAEKNLADCKNKLDNARTAYENAAPALQDGEDGKLRIYVNLSDDVVTRTEFDVIPEDEDKADKWLLMPDYIGGPDETAHFYYTSILGGGKTTSQLIDSVELDSGVTQDMYKYFDFDLNVELDSAQVAYDNAGNATADAADSEINGARVADIDETNNVVTWSVAPATAASSYTANATRTPNGGTAAEIDGGVTINVLATPVSFGGNSYSYKITTSDSKEFFGNLLTSGAPYIEAAAGEGGAYAATTNGATINLTSNATPVTP